MTLEYGDGWQCTADLSRTLYAVRDEIGPRPADALAPMTAVAGMRLRLEAGPSPTSEVAEEPAALQAERRSRTWFGRN